LTYHWTPRDVERLTPDEVAYFMMKLQMDGMVKP